MSCRLAARLSCVLVPLSLAMSACGTIAENTNMLSDDKIVSQSAGALGFEPGELTLESRRTEGTNTYANLKSKSGQEYACIINGGNLLTMGISNPPSCAKKGEPIHTMVPGQ
jgi:hypothetical protein